jgi:HD-GYP domain-containing protein (c-di-GMP phosphodiesterase class II)
MPTNTLNRAAELHSLAQHAHASAAAAHARGDHLAAYELSRQALEHSLNAQEVSARLAESLGRSPKMLSWARLRLKASA